MESVARGRLSPILFALVLLFLAVSPGDAEAGREAVTQLFPQKLTGWANSFYKHHLDQMPQYYKDYVHEDPVTLIEESCEFFDGERHGTYNPSPTTRNMTVWCKFEEEDGDYRFETMGTVIREWVCPINYDRVIINGERMCQLSQYYPDPSRNLGEPDCCTGSNPINPVAGGNKFQRETDYRGNGPFPLEFTRYYNSLASPAIGEDQLRWPERFWEMTPSRLQPDRRARIGVVNHHRTSSGTYWRHSYDRSLSILSPGAVSYFREDGKLIGFALENGAWVPDGGRRIVLEEIHDGQGTRTGWIIKDKDDEVEVFDAGGRLQSITNRAGLTHTLEHGANGDLAAVEDDFGNRLEFETTDGIITGMTDPGGGEYVYAYDEDNNPTQVTYPDGTSRHYNYLDFNLRLYLGSITGDDGEVYASWTYDSSGRAISSEHGQGANRVDITYDSKAQATITDALGRSQVITYANIGGMLKQLSITGERCNYCGNQSARTHYDANGHVRARIDFTGKRTNYVHDAKGRETSRTEGVGTARARTITTTWHADFRVPLTITEPGRLTEYTYDTNGNRLAETVTDTATSESRTTTWTYNSYGQVLTVDGPRTDVSDVTTYTYDASGNLVTVTNALNHVTQYTDYDAHGNPLEIIDPNGIVTELDYDPRQRLVSRTVAAGTADAATTTFDYDAAGQLVETVLPNGASIQYEYDAAHRLIAIEDSLGNRIDYTLDAMGNRINETVSGPGGATFRELARTYNSLNRLVSDTTPEANGASYTYDAEGRRLTVTDTASATTTSQYDALGRLFETVDALSGVTSYEYDPRDNLAKVTDPRGVTTDYTYNGFNELVETDSPDAGTTTYQYDKAGNRISQTDARGITVTYSYDALNRLTFIDYPSSSGGTDQDIAYGYDGAVTGAPNSTGRLTRITDESGSTEYYYGPRGNLFSKVSVVDGTTLAVDYGVDIADNLANMHYPSGAIVNYTRDATGRITGLDVTPAQGSQATVLSNIGYAPFGPVTTLTYGNALTETRSFDSAGRLTAITVPGMLERSYGWDATNNIVAITDHLDSTATQGFDYDTLYRLIDASGAYGSFEWDYDAVGNREEQVFTPPGSTAETTTYTYAATSNRLDTVTDASGAVGYQYDATGNTLADGDSAFVYDDRNRLVEAQDPATQVTTGTYDHNALGQRVAKTINGVTTLFAYDEAGHLIGEYDDTGAVIREYIWLGDRPVAMIDSNGNLHYIHVDHLNTPQVVTDDTQTVVWKGDYTPFGEVDVTVSTVEMNLRFPGQYYDVETGLNYNYFRSYNPGTGRYTQSDPIGLMAGNNLFAYVNANPLRSVDALGLIPDPSCSWWEKLTGSCKEYDTLDEYLDDWLEKQKDAICGGKQCDQVFNDCKRVVVETTLSTGPIEICLRIKDKCDGIKEECKEEIFACNASPSDFASEGVI